MSKLKLKTYWWLIGIFLVTAIAYLPAFQNDFTNWDDYEYVVDNLMIRELTVEKTQEIFSQYYMGNYHPLTMVSLAIDYYFGGIKPQIYLVTNILLHIVNTLFVFWLIFLLFKNRDVAIVTAVLFGVHTLHVESVAWISERKDVLFTMFFLGSLISYVKYLSADTVKYSNSKKDIKRSEINEKIRKRYYGLAIILFIFSVLSKGMAVSLSITLLAIDYLMSRKLLSRKVIAEKIPFLLISIIFGIVAVYAQEVEEYATAKDSFAFYERIVFACYGLIQYIIKLIAPYQLSAFYPYPEGNSIPYVLLLYPAVIIAILFLIFRFVKKNRKFTFGILFFIINIFLVLQLLPVGEAIMADRYCYIPSIGFFCLIGLGFESLIVKKNQIRLFLTISIVLYTVTLVYLTQNRCKIWKDSVTLWSDVIAKYPNVKIAYNNRGLGKEKAGEYESAIDDYNDAIRLDSNYPEAFNNRGISKFKLGNTEEAIEDYERAISLKPGYANAFNNRGNAKGEKGDFKAAIDDFNKALRIETHNPELFYNRGIMKSNMGDFSGSVLDLNKTIKLDPAYIKAYLNRGTSKFYLKDLYGALEDFDESIIMDPEYAEAYFNRGMVKLAMNRRIEGCVDLRKAMEMGFDSQGKEIEKYCK